MVETVQLDINNPGWLALIKQDPAATIFHHPAWIEILSACYGYCPFIFALLDENGQIRAGIPIAEVNDHLSPRRWVALPFSDYCAPIYRDEESIYQLTIALIEQHQAKRCPRLEIRTALPGQAGLQTRAPFVIHQVPLEVDPAKVAKRTNRQQMQNVRTAEKNDIRIVRGAGLKEVQTFYQLHSLSRRKHGVPVQPWHFFELITKQLLKQNLGFVLLAYKGDKCISAGLFLHWHKTLTYKYSATDEANMNLRPNHLVTWTAMKWGCENGYTSFDFGRSELEDEGLRSYKRRWGANEIPLSYSYFPSAPAEIAQGNGRLRALSKAMIRHSPVWVCQAIGQLMYRYVG